jgi:membrane protease YdiL (CAAX protease family)
MIFHVRKHPLLAYYILAFAISWGAILVIVGPSGFLTTTGTSAIFPVVGIASLLGPSIAGLVMTGLVGGRAGFADLLTRLRHWRVGAGWYAIALLTAPLVNAGALLVLSLTSSEYQPALFTSDNRLSLLLLGLTSGLLIAFCEELGWTGFATPRFLLGHGVFATGLTMGVIWGLWHLPLFAGNASDAGPVGPILMMAVLLFAWLPPYRILMVWVYDHTQSLPVVMLMHVLIVVGMYIFNIEGSTPAVRFTSTLAVGLGFWLVVGAVALASHRQLTLPRRARVAPDGAAL